jgi:sugar/nucleoside kinase (ribokinase family)
VILVVGEALVDVVDGTPHPGGSPTNVAVGLGRLGLDVTLATALGDDDHGALLRRRVAAAGVDLQAAVIDRTSSRSQYACTADPTCPISAWARRMFGRRTSTSHRAAASSSLTSSPDSRLRWPW